MKSILVCYYTETQSTKEVCKAIVEKLQNNHTVELKPIDEVQHIAAFDTVIIGAPVHGMKWHMKAFKFVEGHAEELKTKQTIYFAMASLAYQGRNFWQKKVFKALEDASQIVQPFETSIFGGISGDVPKVLRFLFGLPKDVKKDQRDWELINQWINKLVRKIEQ